MIEERNTNVSIGKVGGNASKNSVYYKLCIPNTWAKELGISNDDRLMQLSFDGKQIIIKKRRD